MGQSVVWLVVLLAGCATGNGTFSCGRYDVQWAAGDSQACIEVANCCPGIVKTIDTERLFDYTFDL
ncbi:MAG: hypothetical protein OES46_14565 [Gammaproteobacteria bacterium]|jgi:hypothetical protein|nr:hypothetical protein [Gammaproteobacteria bacterium]